MIIKEIQRPPTWVRTSAIGGSEKVDPIKTADLMLENAMRPKLEEPAIVHPFNTSVLKIKNNGMIDMFVGTDQGIRIDPYSKTINEIADGLKWHIGYFNGWVEKDAKWHAYGEILFNSEASAVSLNAKTDVSIIAGRNVTIKCDGVLTLSSTEGVNIDTKGGFELNGEGFNLSSNGEVTLGGKSVSIGTGSASSVKAKAKAMQTRDGCSCSTGEISSGSNSVYIDGLPAARLGDEVTIL